MEMGRSLQLASRSTFIEDTVSVNKAARGSEVAQQVKAPSQANPDDLNSGPGTHVMHGRRELTP